MLQARISDVENERSQIQIGSITFTVLLAEEDPEIKARWDRRAEALAELLLTMWRREQQRQEASSTDPPCRRNCLDVHCGQR